ncbi:MAG: MlaD family protein [Ignavibacteriaceae bacterium]
MNFKSLAGVKLGVFIFIGSVLLVVGIFMLGNKQALFSSTFNVNAYFTNIEGLRNGAPVRLSGIDVGSVSNIEIVDDTSGRVKVEMRLLTEIERFIRTDTKASIQTEGLVGNKVVVLEIGSSLADPVGEGGTIMAKDPVGFAEIIEETQGIMNYTREMTRNLSEIMEKINKGEGSLGKILTDDELYNAATDLTYRAGSSLGDITDQLNTVTGLFEELGLGVQEVVVRVNSVVTQIDTTLSKVNRGQGVIGSLLVEGSPADSTLYKTLQNLVQITEDAKIGASRLAENMEALKHNWLFKGYFEERGYWDKEEFEGFLDEKISELNEKIQTLDERINELQKLQNSQK